MVIYNDSIFGERVLMYWEIRRLATSAWMNSFTSVQPLRLEWILLPQCRGFQWSSCNMCKGIGSSADFFFNSNFGIFCDTLPSSFKQTMLTSNARFQFGFQNHSALRWNRNQENQIMDYSWNQNWNRNQNFKKCWNRNRNWDMPVMTLQARVEPMWYLW